MSSYLLFHISTIIVPLLSILPWVQSLIFQHQAWQCG